MTTQNVHRCANIHIDVQIYTSMTTQNVHRCANVHIDVQMVHTELTNLQHVPPCSHAILVLFVTLRYLHVW